MFTEMILLGLAIASIAMTITKSNVMESLRNRASKLGRWARELMHCPYCLSHWLAFAAVWLKFGLLPLGQFVLVSFGVITIASFASFGIAALFLALDALD
jgi:hypothetical protein